MLACHVDGMDRRECDLEFLCFINVISIQEF